MAGWSDQEIANLLIAHRRHFNEDLKLRDSYYAKTISKARAAFGSVEENDIAEVPAEVQTAPTVGPAPPKAVSIASIAKEPCRRSVSEHLATISRAFGITVVRVTKYGSGQDGTYELTVLDAEKVERKIDIGNGLDILNPRLVQGAILGGGGGVIPTSGKMTLT